jgi:hypothetical protein
MQGQETRITSPMPAVRTPVPAVSIGLFLAVTGHYPNLPDFLSPALRKREKEAREKFPDRPATYVTVEDEEEFAQKLSQLTGRKFFVPDEGLVEVMIRGREKGSNHITASRNYFGDDSYNSGPEKYRVDVQNYAWINQTYPLGVRQMPEGKNFINSYGLIHPSGNVSIKSRQGTTFGGSFNGKSATSGKKGNSRENTKWSRDAQVGFRVAESI